MIPETSGHGITVFAAVENDMWGWRWKCNNCNYVNDRLNSDETEAVLAAAQHYSRYQRSSISRRTK